MATAQDIATTQRFIDYRPDTVMVSRRDKEATPDGGWKFGAPADVGEVTLRVVEMLRTQATLQRTTASGKLVTPSHQAIALPDVDVERYDMFSWDGMDWEVVWVSHLPDWRTQLELVGHGGS